MLTHWCRELHTCVIGRSQQWFQKCFVAIPAKPFPEPMQTFGILKIKNISHFFSIYIEEIWIKISSGISCQISMGFIELTHSHTMSTLVQESEMASVTFIICIYWTNAASYLCIDFSFKGNHQLNIKSKFPLFHFRKLEANISRPQCVLKPHLVT